MDDRIELGIQHFHAMHEISRLETLILLIWIYSVFENTVKEISQVRTAAIFVLLIKQGY
jgi:hypothetical protein